MEDAAAALLARMHEVQWWCFMEEWNLWSPYDTLENQQIERAWQADVDSVFLDSDAYADHWEINFVSLTQVTPHTGTRRRVQRTLITNQ